ncbi:hypothetical protein ACWCY6_18065 [Streptomyces sp. 900105755]
MERLDGFLAGLARPGGGGSLMLLGDPGVGKSALLAAAVRRAEAAGLRVLEALGCSTGRRRVTARCSSC